MPDPLLRLRDLRTYVLADEPPVKAVDGVTLDISSGEMLCLVGESGCGKTMLALSIGGLLPPAARVVGGSILFEGRNLAALPEEDLRRLRGSRIAYVFQDPMGALNPVMTIGDQLLEPLRMHQGLRGRDALSRAAALLEQVQIPLPERRLRQYPHQLSGGMRQRGVIAMALAGRPSLLIADEPTTALDVTTQHEILLLLRRLQRELSMSVLLITHDLTAVAPVSDRIAVMYAGRIVETAPTPLFFREPSHPYAQALLRCIPAPAARDRALQSIPGSVPDLRFTPPGCPFHPRCPERVERCGREEPHLKPVPGTSRVPGTDVEHRVSCWARESTRV